MNKKKLWILNYIKNTPTKSIDILSCDFTDKYIKEFNPKTIKYKMWGAHYTPELSMTLKQMKDQNILHRKIMGLGNLPQGFLKWVYIYSIEKEVK